MGCLWYLYLARWSGSLDWWYFRITFLPLFLTSLMYTVNLRIWRCMWMVLDIGLSDIHEGRIRYTYFCYLKLSYHHEVHVNSHRYRGKRVACFASFYCNKFRSELRNTPLRLENPILPAWDNYPGVGNPLLLSHQYISLYGQLAYLDICVN